jgi:hypothetical protein
MRKNAEYAVARRNGIITVSRDEAENLLESRTATDRRTENAGGEASGHERPTHKRRAADRPHRGLRLQADIAGQRVRGLLSRAWQSISAARNDHDDGSSAA